MQVGGRLRDRQGHRRIAAHRRQAEHGGRERPGRDDRAHSARAATSRRSSPPRPGITDEARNRGIQIDGASGADNRFLIDGVDTTNLLNGTSGKALPPDFVDTVQAKASGYSAEYRASLGGVISAITKSGGNAVSRQRRHLLHRRQPARRRPRDAAARIRRTRRSRRVRDDAARRLLEPRADLRSRWSDSQGSPVVLRRLRPELDEPDAHRAVQQQRAARHVQPEAEDRTSSTTTSAARSPRTCADDSRRRTSATRAATPCRRSGPLGVSTSNPALFPSVIRRDTSNDSYSGVLDWVVNNKTYVNLTVDPVQGRSARRRHVQHGAAAHLPGVDEHLQSDAAPGSTRLPVP